MERLKYPLNHEWHVAINVHAQEQPPKQWPRFMYEAKTAADEVPRMAMLFKQERERALPQTHQQCSMQAPVPVKDNHLSCCLGVKTRECPHLLALEKIVRCTPEDIDDAKAWTCASHIIGKGGDMMGEGYLLRVDDRMYWDNVYASLAQSDDSGPNEDAAEIAGDHTKPTAASEQDERKAAVSLPEAPEGKTALDSPSSGSLASRGDGAPQA